MVSSELQLIHSVSSAIPVYTSGAAPTDSFRLNENGDYFLLENGDYKILG